MPFDGSGNYTPPTAPAFPAVTGQTIVAAYYNSVINDLAVAMSNCITRDGQGKPSASINWNGQKITNLANGVNPADAVNLSQLGGYALLASAPTFTGLITGSAGFSGTTLALSSNLTIGNNSAASTATPLYADFGGTYSSVAGANPKIKLFNDGTNVYGFGASLTQLDYITPAGTTHNFYVGGVLHLSIGTTGLVTANGGLSSNGALTLTGVLTSGTAPNSVGYLGLPQATVHTASYTFVLADASIDQAFNGAGLTATIPSNASVAYPIGTILIGTNLNASSLTVAITTDTLIWSGTTTTGSRTIGQNGEFRARKITATSWLITGTAMS